MAYRNQDPGGFLPDEPGGIVTDPSTTTPTESTGVSFTLIGYDRDGKDVYQGTDGKLYTGDPTAPNGMGLYSGPGVVSQTPTTPRAGGDLDLSGGGTTGGTVTSPIGTSAFDYTPTAAPVFDAPGYTPPPAFDYQPFVAPTGADVLNDPGYAFRLKQGEQALLNNRAARGVLNTGGTLKDFLGYNQNFASQEYGNAWARAADAYRMNRGNALDIYNTNYGTQYKDPYNFNYTAALDTFGPQFDAWKIATDAAAHGKDQENYYRWVVANA